MNRNGNYIKDKIIDPNGYSKPAQVGVDLSISKIEDISGDVYFDENSKVHNIEYKEAPYTINEKNIKVYCLEPNHNYSITFQQGLRTLNNNEWAFIVQRSSLVRCGVHVISSVFDPGYGIDAENGIGTTLFTGNIPVKIPVGTRVAQMLVFENEPVCSEDLYNGRWQGTNKV